MITRTSERIGDYELLEFFGKREHCRIFKARAAAHYPVHQMHDGVCALKVFARISKSSPAYQQFKSQADELIHRPHPHVVPVLDAFYWPPGQSTASPCLVQEWPGNKKLSDVARAGPPALSPERVAELFHQILDALNYVRQSPVRMKYLHPDHIYLDGDGKAKLSGYTLDCFADRNGASLAGDEDFFDYLSPDFAEAADFGDEISLIFSFGVCFHLALTGKLPYPRLEDRTAAGECFSSVAAAFLGRWQEPVRLSPALEAGGFRSWPATKRFLEKCVQPRRELRYQSFRELRADLDVVSAELSFVPKPIPLTAPKGPVVNAVPAAARSAPKRIGSTPRFAWAALTAGLVVLLGAGYAAWRGHFRASAATIHNGTRAALESTLMDRGGEQTMNAASRRPEAEANIEIDLNMIPAPDGAPPIQVSYRYARLEIWRPSPDPFLVTPGPVDLRFERADYVPIEKSVEVPSDIQSFLVNGPRPGDWRPGESLRQLGAVESAWQEGDVEAVSAEFARPMTGLLAWPDHQARLSRVREQWLAVRQKEELALSRKAIVVEVIMPVGERGEPPISIFIAQPTGTRWIPVKESFRLRPGEYLLRFTRADYESIQRPFTVTADQDRQQVLGPVEAEWKPGTVLQELIDLEKAWADGADDTVTRRFALPWVGSLEYRGHRNRLNHLKEEWYTRLFPQK